MKWSRLLVLFLIVSSCNLQVAFDQLLWLENRAVDTDIRLRMVDDLQGNYLLIGTSKDQTISLLGQPNKTESDFVPKDIMEGTRSKVTDVLNSSKLSVEERLSVLEEWFHPAILFQEQLYYTVAWTNGEEPYPLYLKIVFVTSKLVSTEIFLEK